MTFKKTLASFFQSLPETEVDVSDRETFLDNWSSVQTSRLSNVSRVCALMDAGSESWGDNDYNTGGDGFVCDPDLRVAYCHVPKAASTWWLAVFARAYGLKEENITHLIKHKVRMIRIVPRRFSSELPQMKQGVVCECKRFLRLLLSSRQQLQFVHEQYERERPFFYSRWMREIFGSSH